MKEKVVVSNRELLEIGVGLRKVFEAQVEFKLAYRVSKISRQVLKLMEKVEAARVKYCQEFGEKQSDGSYKVVGKMAEFAQAYNAELAKEVELEFEPIPREMFKNEKISANELVALERFLTPE